MSDPRILGLVLMSVSIAAFLGSTSGALPAVTFFPAFLLFAVGAFEFLRTNHEAMAKAKERTSRTISPRLRENRMARTLADKQAASKALGLGSVEPNITTDVSFPLEVQMDDAVGDQLSKLSRLLEQRVLTEEEYSIAKAKILA